MSPMGEAMSVCRPSRQIIETRQLQRPKGGFPVMAETTRNHIFSKEISQVIIAAMVLAPISIEKIVCE